MNERHSDFGTKAQSTMRNRILLGDERGGVRKAYVMSNMDIIRDFDKSENENSKNHTPLIDEIQYETGKTYWAWRTIARREMGYHENRAYGDTPPGEEVQPENLNDTPEGHIQAMFIILCGIMDTNYLMTVDACCNDADHASPLQILQAFQMMGLGTITAAFESLEKKMQEARKIFEKRLEEAKENV